MSTLRELLPLLLGGVAGVLLAALIVQVGISAHLIAPDNGPAGFLMGAAGACLGMYAGVRFADWRESR